jgi:hypothetical protein
VVKEQLREMLVEGQLMEMLLLKKLLLKRY